MEKQFEQEDRELVPSPKVATYDKQPEMSAQGVADKVAETVTKGDYEFVMCNFAPPDMVRLSAYLKCLINFYVGGTYRCVRGCRTGHQCNGQGRQG